MDEIKRHWLDIITDYFPEESELTLSPTKDDFSLDVSWKLITDQNRPSKRSRILRLIIPDETIQDYSNAGDTSKSSYDQRLIDFVKDTINKFQPDHDTPIGQPRPVETVRVPFGIT